MKKIMLITTIILVCLSSFGQIKNNDYKRMIDSAIIMQRAAYKPNVYLIDEKDQPFLLSSDGLRDKFKYITVYEKKNRELLRKGINAWKILPVLNGNQLTIDIIDFTITYKENNYVFRNGGGATATFEFSCNEHKWVLKKSKWNGI